MSCSKIQKRILKVSKYTKGNYEKDSMNFNTAYILIRYGSIIVGVTRYYYLTFQRSFNYFNTIYL